MATTYTNNDPNTEYYRKRPEIVKIFDDLDEYRKFCRANYMKFDEAALYRRDSYEYRAFLSGKNPRKQNKTRR